MRRGGLIIGLVALLLAAAAGWYVLSPLWTLRQMTAAAEADDAQALSNYVDFPAVRASTKAQVKAQLMEPSAAGSGNGGLGALGAMLAMQLVDPAVDAMITPEALALALANRERENATSARARQAVTPGGGFQLPQLPQLPENAEVVRGGLNRFTLRDKERPDAGTLQFERRGLGWRLVALTLPNAAPPDPHR